MSEDATRRLENLLAAHTTKEQQVAGAADRQIAAQAAKEQKTANATVEKIRADFELMRAFLPVRDTVLKPVAMEFAERLMAAGHRARVESTDPLPQTLYAAAREGRLGFALSLKSASETSVLTFIGYPTAVQTHYDYSFRGGRSASLSGHELRPPEITKGVAEDILLDFIAKVLRETHF